jgi:hypothetical protein
MPQAPSSQNYCLEFLQKLISISFPYLSGLITWERETSKAYFKQRKEKDIARGECTHATISAALSVNGF